MKMPRNQWKGFSVWIGSNNEVVIRRCQGNNGKVFQ